MGLRSKARRPLIVVHEDPKKQPREPRTCPECGGSKAVQVQPGGPFSIPGSIACPTCSGRGTV
jgi:DnaJ-class molecular chaperone